MALTNRDPKNRAPTPDEFNPYTPKKSGRGVRLTPATIGMLKVFVK